MVITAATAATTAVAAFLTAMTQFCGSSFFSCLFSATTVAVTQAFQTDAAAITTVAKKSKGLLKINSPLLIF